MGVRLSKKLTGGEIVLLKGPLGAGKTEFVSGLASGFGIKKRIISPTFILEHRYPFTKAGRKLTLCHLDLYRIKGTKELTFMAPDDVGTKDYVFVIEWPKILEKKLPRTRITVNLAYGKKENERTIRIEP